MWGLLGLLLAGAGAVFGVAERSADRSPSAWRELAPEEAQRFELGHAVFNSQWVEANRPAGRRDGLGPLFNSSSCDACHNSRRRGRGPLQEGVAPQDLVIQLGTRQADGTVARGSLRFGHVVNTSANSGLPPEADVAIQYEEILRDRADGSRISLRMPVYRVVPTRGAALAADTVLMPRMPPPVQGVGLLERVPEKEIVALAALQSNSAGRARGRVAWIDAGGDRVVGRFGWQATEPAVQGQISAAFSREMGLTTPSAPRIDCGADARDCHAAASGGEPEVEAELFDAIVAFQRLEAVGRTVEAAQRLAASDEGRHLFEQAGCSTCHVPRLHVDPAHDDGGETWIEPYTDLLLHDLGEDLSDRDAAGHVAAGMWRTAPLWGLNQSFATGRPVHLLHDGRARGIDEAISWHGGEAAASRDRYERLHPDQRRELVAWVSSL